MRDLDSEHTATTKMASATLPVAWEIAAFIGFELAAGCCVLGAGWLLMKTEGKLQRRAVGWGERALWLMALGIAGVSLATPLLSPTIFARWFDLPNILWLAPVPLLTALLFVLAVRSLRRIGQQLGRQLGLQLEQPGKAPERGVWITVNLSRSSYSLTRDRRKDEQEPPRSFQ